MSLTTDYGIQERVPCNWKPGPQVRLHKLAVSAPLSSAGPKRVSWLQEYAQLSVMQLAHMTTMGINLFAQLRALKAESDAEVTLAWEHLLEQTQSDAIPLPASLERFPEMRSSCASPGSREA